MKEYPWLAIGAAIREDFFNIKINCLRGLVLSKEMAEALKNLSCAICEAKCNLEISALLYDGKKVMIPHNEVRVIVNDLNLAFMKFKAVMEAQGYHKGSIQPWVKSWYIVTVFTYSHYLSAPFKCILHI